MTDSSDSIARRTRSATSRPTSAASSPAAAEPKQSDSHSLARRDNLPTTLAHNEKVVPDIGRSHRSQKAKSANCPKNAPVAATQVCKGSVPQELATPLRPKPAVPFLHPQHGSRLSVASTSSSSTINSLKKADDVFDSPVPSPACDSNPTSPEEDAMSPHDKRSAQSFWNNSPCPKIDAVYALHVPEVASQPIISIQSPASGRQRSNSVPSPTKPRSCSADPSNSNADDGLITGVKRQSLGERTDAKSSTGSRRASSTGHAKLTVRTKGRAASAAGRMKECLTDVGTRPETSEENSSSYEVMDWKPSLGAEGLEAGNALQPRLPEQSSAVNVITQQSPGITRKGPSVPPSRAVTPEVEPPRSGGTSTSAQYGAMEGIVQRKNRRKPRGQLSTETRPVVMPEAEVGSESASSSRQSKPNDVGPTSQVGPEEEGPAEFENVPGASAGVSGGEDIPDTEARPAATPQGADAVPEEFENVPGANDGVSDVEDIPDTEARSAGTPQGADAVPEEFEMPVEFEIPKAGKEHGSSVLERFYDDVLTKGDIQMELIKIINPEPKNKRPPQKCKKGSIYIYSSPEFKQEGGLGSADTYRYYKIGWSHSQTPSKRRKQQRRCGLEIIPIDDAKQRNFYFSGIVDDLIKCELREHKRKSPCRTLEHTRRNGSPSEHEEWFEIGLQHLLEVIEKWRGWVTECDPFHRDGTLRPRWVWKLALLERSKGNVDLGSILQPFTLEEKLSHRWRWIEKAWDDYFSGHEDASTALVKLVFIAVSIWAPFVYLLGCRLGSSVFVGSSLLLLNYFSGR